MPRLRIISEVLEGRVMVLNLGANTIGRHPNNHFQIEDPTVSGTHCEIVVEGEAVVVRDAQSTNGTYLDGKRIEHAALFTGQVLRLGTIECLVEDATVAVSIPEVRPDVPAPPRVLEDGLICCPQHEAAIATHRCPKCRRVMCLECVRRLRRQGGKEMLLCPACSNPVEQMVASKPQPKHTFKDFFKTIKVPFTSPRKRKRKIR